MVPCSVDIAARSYSWRVTQVLRAGSRPSVSVDGPQTQLTQRSTPALWGQLVARVFEMDAVVEGHSQVSPPSSRAIFLTDVLIERAPETSLAPGRRLEPVHLHGIHDTSLHLCLPAARGAELTSAGWSEPHLYEDFGTEFMIYGPRDESELDFIVSIVIESLDYARRRPLTS